MAKSKKDNFGLLPVVYNKKWSNYVLPHNEEARFNKAHKTDAGFDLYYAGPKIIIPGQQSAKLSTGVHINIPSGFYGKIMDRSSIASKTPLIARGGVIDSGYTGEIQVIMHNLIIDPFHLDPGLKFAQLVIMPIATPQIDVTTELEETDRSDKGFGSTGA